MNENEKESNNQNLICLKMISKIRSSASKKVLAMFSTFNFKSKSQFMSNKVQNQVFNQSVQSHQCQSNLDLYATILLNLD